MPKIAKNVQEKIALLNYSSLCVSFHIRQKYLVDKVLPDEKQGKERAERIWKKIQKLSSS